MPRICLRSESAGLLGVGVSDTYLAVRSPQALYRLLDWGEGPAVLYTTVHSGPLDLPENTGSNTAPGGTISSFPANLSHLHLKVSLGKVLLFDRPVFQIEIWSPHRLLYSHSCRPLFNSWGFAPGGLEIEARAERKNLRDPVAVGTLAGRRVVTGEDLWRDLWEGSLTYSHVSAPFTRL
jgi:hypothetical protein